VNVIRYFNNSFAKGNFYVKAIKLLRFVQHNLYRVIGKKIGDYPRPPESLKEIGFFDKKREIHTVADNEKYFKNSPIYREGNYTQIKPGLITLVKDSERILIRKSFKGLRKQSEFYNELVCLNRLREIDGVPNIRYVDYSSLSIYMDYIDGVTVSWKRVHPGLVINADNIHLFKKEFSELLISIHQAGIILYDLKGSNMIWDGSKPYVIDFGDSLYFKKGIPDLAEFLMQREYSKMTEELKKYSEMNPVNSNSLHL